MTVRLLSALALLLLLAPGQGYRRADWPHWIGSCPDTRNAVLKRDAIHYTLSPDGCRVVAGVWLDPYTGQLITDPRDADIDHWVPLSAAHNSGGASWTRAQKQEYANSLTFRYHLTVTSARVNRAKGAKSPDQWKPPSTGAWCQYALNWSAIKTTWNLTTTAPEREALREMLATCP